MKMYAPATDAPDPSDPVLLATSLLTTLGRLMSDYEVTLVNDNSTIPMSPFPFSLNLCVCTFWDSR